MDGLMDLIVKILLNFPSSHDVGHLHLSQRDVFVYLCTVGAENRVLEPSAWHSDHS